MEFSYPARVPFSEHRYLGDFSGTLTTLLESMLFDLDCDPNIPVRVYTFYDGNLFVKYRIVLRLPRQLGYETVMPAGEARTEIAAYRIAVIKAITTIREDKALELVDTNYNHIPHDSMDREPRVDYHAYVQNKPEEAAEELKRYHKLMRSFFTTHQVLARDLQEMLEEFTDPIRVSDRRHRLDEEAKREIENPPTPIYTGHIRDDSLPPTPVYRPRSPAVERQYRATEADPWEVASQESPIGNSSGWRWGSGSGYQADGDQGDEGSSVNPGQVLTSYHVGECSKVNDVGEGCDESTRVMEGNQLGEPYNPNEMEEDPYETEDSEEECNPTEVYESLEHYFSATDFTLGTSDSDYTPTGRPYVPTTLRRTARFTGWTPGMYREETDDE